MISLLRPTLLVRLCRSRGAATASNGSAVDAQGGALISHWRIRSNCTPTLPTSYNRPVFFSHSVHALIINMRTSLYSILLYILVLLKHTHRHHTLTHHFRPNTCLHSAAQEPTPRARNQSQTGSSQARGWTSGRQSARPDCRGPCICRRDT